LWSKNGKKALKLTGVVPLDNNKRASVAACHWIERNEIPIPKEQEQHDDDNNNNNKKLVSRNRKTTTKKMMMNINLPTPDRQYNKESGDDTSYITNSYFK
jgi:hypothetical protein